MSNGFLSWLSARLRRFTSWLTSAPASVPPPAPQLASPPAKLRRPAPTSRSSRQHLELQREDETARTDRPRIDSPASGAQGAARAVKTFILYGEHPVEVVERRRRDGAAVRTRFFLTVGVDEPRAISFDHGVFVAIGGEERIACLFVPATDLSDPVRFRRAYRVLDELCARQQRRQG